MLINIKLFVEVLNDVNEYILMPILSDTKIEINLSNKVE